MIIHVVVLNIWIVQYFVCAEWGFFDMRLLQVSSWIRLLIAGLVENYGALRRFLYCNSKLSSKRLGLRNTLACLVCRSLWPLRCSLLCCRNEYHDQSQSQAVTLYRVSDERRRQADRRISRRKQLIKSLYQSVCVTRDLQLLLLINAWMLFRCKWT